MFWRKIVPRECYSINCSSDINCEEVIAAEGCFKVRDLHSGEQALLCGMIEFVSVERITKNDGNIYIPKSEVRIHGHKFY